MSVKVAVKVALTGGEERAGQSKYMHWRERNCCSPPCSPSQPVKKVPGLAPGDCDLGDKRELQAGWCHVNTVHE